MKGNQFFLAGVVHPWKGPGIGYIAVFASEEEAEAAYPKVRTIDGQLRTSSPIPGFEVVDFQQRSGKEEAAS